MLRLLISSYTFCFSKIASLIMRVLFVGYYYVVVSSVIGVGEYIFELLKELSLSTFMLYNTKL